MEMQNTSSSSNMEVEPTSAGTAEDVKMEDAAPALAPVAVGSVPLKEEEEEPVFADDEDVDFDATKDDTHETLPGRPLDSRASSDPEMSPDEIEKAESEVSKIQRIKEEQQKALEEIKQKQKSSAEVEKESQLKSRLRYVLEQTDIFTHFMQGHISAKNTTNKRLAKGKSRAHLLTEEEEDGAMLQDAMDEIKPTGTHMGGTRLTAQPALIQNGSMREYQLEGLNWLIKLYECGVNGILADEMGLGKTLQTISLLAYLREARHITGPHLVITPKSTLSSWFREFGKWCPVIRVVKFHGSKDERESLKQNELRPGAFDVCLTSYEIAIKEKAAMRKFNFKYLIIDEAHRIKNEQSVLSQVIRTYSSLNRLLITGTPLQNNLHELWALLNFLMPEVFNSAEDFDSWFDLSKASQDDQDYIIKQLHRILRPFMLRRLKSDVEKKLPPKKEIYIFVGLSEVQKTWYRNILTKNIDVVNGRGDKVRLLNILMQLRKACNHPYLFDGAEPGPPYIDGPHLIENAGKMVVLDRLLPKLKQQGSRVLIFSQMTRLLDILDDYMRLRGFEYCRIDGQTPGDMREDAIDEFNKPGSSKFVFLLSTRAGGLGINLYTADTVILYDSDWNPQMDLQAMDRAHRIGQTKQVMVYRFVSENTVEEKIVERAAKKLKMDHLIIQKGRLTQQTKGPSKEEMSEIIQFGAQQVFRSKDSTVTDQDIEDILNYATKKTDEINQKLSNIEETFNLQTFTLNSATAATKMYEFEGKDHKKEVPKEEENIFKAPVQFIDIGQRERKNKSYDVNAYYREALRVGEPGKAQPKQIRKGWRATVGGGHPFQFFDNGRLDELEMKEKIWDQYKKDKEKAEQAEAGGAESTSDLPVPDEFTEDDKEEKERLLTEGFADWTKKDFNSFIRGCEKHGRDSFNEIVQEVETKPLKDVKEYSKVFWTRWGEIENGKRLVERIERGESEIQRRTEIANALAAKMKRHRDPWRTLSIHYGGSAAQKGKVFNEDEDRFLLCAMYKHGYGAWEDVKAEIRHAWQFRFNWFIKSRTPLELSRRCDTLIRLVEKENADIEAKEAEKRKKAAAALAAAKKKEQLKAAKAKEKEKEKEKTPKKSSTTTPKSSGKKGKKRKQDELSGESSAEEVKPKQVTPGKKSAEKKKGKSKKEVPKKKSLKEESDDLKSESGSDLSSENETLSRKAQKMSKKKSTPKSSSSKKAKKEESESDLESGSESEPQPKHKSKKKEKEKVKEKSKKKQTKAVSDSEEETKHSKQSKKSKSHSKSNSKSKAPESDLSDVSDSDDAKKKQKKPLSSSKKPKSDKRRDESGSEVDSESDREEVKSKVNKKSSAKKKSKPERKDKKRFSVESDNDSDSAKKGKSKSGHGQSDNDASDEEAPIKKAKPTSASLGFRIPKKSKESDSVTKEKEKPISKDSDSDDDDAFEKTPKKFVQTKLKVSYSKQANGSKRPRVDDSAGSSSKKKQRKDSDSGDDSS